MSTQSFTTVLFDLDGTLLPMDQKRFMESYLVLFSQKCDELSLPVKLAVHALNMGFQAMLENDGTITNEKRFWQVFSQILEMDVDDRIVKFTRFYSNEFKQLRAVADYSPLSRRIVETVRSKGYRVVLATTPVFPRPGTLERIAWAGLQPEWFELITTYEDFSFAKPNLGYYQEILQMIESSAHQCLMVGNDVTEDIVAQQLGMDVFLVTDHIINRDKSDISHLKQGSLQDLLQFCESLPPR